MKKARTVVRFDKLLTELHRTTDDKATVCGQTMTDPTVVWIDWPHDGTPDCPACVGTETETEAMF